MRDKAGKIRRGCGGRGEEWREHFRAKTISPRDTQPGSDRPLEICKSISKEAWARGTDMGTITESQRWARSARREPTMEPWETLNAQRGRRGPEAKTRKRWLGRECQEGDNARLTRGRRPAVKEPQPWDSQETPKCTARDAFILGGVELGRLGRHRLRNTLWRRLVVTRKKENMGIEGGLGEKEDGFVRGRTCAHAQHLREGAEEGGGLE